MASEQFSLCWDNFHKNMSSGMNSLLENEDLVDVTLAVEGKCLKAHKMVLSVCSPYFKELFKSNPCQHPIVFMKDVSYVALSDLLQFMYQGEVQVSQENLTTFIKTAEALQIKGLTGDGNGSADTDPIETPQEKPVHQIEEYKPMPRPKKQQPATVTTQSTPVKRPRLSVSSTDSQPLPPAVAKSEPVASVPSGGSSEPVQFKMEPYDQTQSLIDETGDENFGDDNLDDANVDDTEDYSMMEGGTGEEEPQAGTSTDGAGEGQEEKYILQMGMLKKLPQNGIVVDGFTYHQNTRKKNSNMRYLVCSEYKRLICKARAVLPVGGTIGDFVLRKEHNHPPHHEACIRDDFIKEIKFSIVHQPDRPLKQIYEDVATLNPQGAEICPYNKIVTSMRRWRCSVWKSYDY
ncbi:protein tramtrack, beta isoform isoform X5 [Anoplophora glabripennis]|uniref:protein tramtrack, beta isoform isoform X5 n=1 Tax=Anoplophora glabripennis TaxID=217634 RepID=UPI000874BB91|nr:protein tramtrack, beta isoform isoform X5 [Anoplophora glabripennis]